MLRQVHLLLSYTCILKCDHCFVCSGPTAEGTFALSRINEVLDQAKAAGTVDTIYFEGGEPFLFYPLLIEGIRQARNRGFSVGIVTNGFFATSRENARLFLDPVAELGIADISISDDAFHYENRVDNPARCAFAVAREMGLPASVLAEEPVTSQEPDRSREGSGDLSHSSIMFRGRAAGTLSRYATLHDGQQFTRCPYEDLEHPQRLHVDPYGNLLICQGISMGNIREHPLAELVNHYRASAHPVCGPLVRGGPALLAHELGYVSPGGVADACHLCFLARRSALGRYPEILCPRQVYCDE